MVDTSEVQLVSSVVILRSVAWRMSMSDLTEEFTMLCVWTLRADWDQAFEKGDTLGAPSVQVSPLHCLALKQQM